MKKSLAYFMVILLALGCKSKDKKPAQNDLPDCISKEIDAIKQHKEQNPPIAIREYEYDGKRVFFYEADCCDQFDELYDMNCNIICSPSGGFDGVGDGKCADFGKNAKMVKVIWERDHNDTGGKK